MATNYDEYTLSLGTETWEMNRDQIALIAPRTLHSIVQKTDLPTTIKNRSSSSYIRSSRKASLP